MVQRYYQLVQEYNPRQQYPLQIPDRIATCLSLMKRGETFRPAEFARKNHKKLTPKDNPKASLQTVSKSICIGKKIGIIQDAKTHEQSLEEFAKLETVQHFVRQLRKSRFKHPAATYVRNLSGTAASYLYQLRKFHNWLIGREFTCKKTIQTGEFTFEIRPQTVTLEGLEHLFRLYESRNQNDPDFVRIIKKYLLSDIHKHKKWISVNVAHSAIIAYFKKNEHSIEFDWDPQAIYADGHDSDDGDTPIMTLQDLLEMLTTGKPSVTEKAIVLCKFHRGLDNSTFSDRFNYEAWGQLVEYFGTDEYATWDLKKCPVPIILTRIKTSYKHRGFLDVDAIRALQLYLNYRQKKTGKPMRDGEPLFISKAGTPITDVLVRRIIPKLAERCQIQRIVRNYHTLTRYEKTSHELRDLLKSTLIMCGTIGYVCELAIGHKVGDSYEKQDQLYPEKSRIEFARASKTINIFSNISNVLKGDTEKDALRQEVADLKDMLARQKSASKTELEQVREETQKILAWIERQEASK